MGVRQDKIQLIVEINGQKAGGSIKDLRSEARKLKRAMDNATDPKDVERYAKDLQKVNTKLADIRNMSKAVKNEASGLSSTFKKMLPALGAVAIVAGMKRIVSGMVSLGRESLRLFNIQAQADAQLKAGLKSTGGLVGRTFEQLKKQAQDLQRQTLFGDEQVQSAQSILLTFTNIRKEVFDRSIPAVLDYATKLKTAPKDAALQLGKALNDPIKGITALSRAGVQFSEDQKAMIKSLVESGQVAEAQGVILKELETQFKGSAQAAAEAGTGGLTQLSNRIGDIKEGIGLLINNGLKRIQPFLEKVVVFFEKFVDRLITGEKATGDMAGSVNALYKGFQILTAMIRTSFEIQKSFFQFVGRIVTPIIRNVANGVTNLIDRARQLPIIGTIINRIGSVFIIFQDLIGNTAATFEGLRAAADQAVENIKTYFSGLVTSATILKLKLQRALTISADQRSRLSQEIKDLENLKVEAASAGQTIGEAYSKARNDAIKANAIANSSDPEATAEDLGLPTNIPDIQISSGSSNSKKTKEKKKDGLNTGTQQASIISAAYEALQKNVEKNLEEIDQAADKTLDEHQIRFLQKMLTEQEYQELSYQSEVDFIQQKLDLLEQFGLKETEAFRKLQIEQLEIQKEYDDKKAENAKRTSDLKTELAGLERDAANKALNFAIRLFGKDEEARKKNAGALKAFEIAKTDVNLYSEIQGIWKNAKISLPEPFASILAAVQTALSIARANKAKSAIASKKFFYGGFTGYDSVYHDGMDGVAGIAHIGEWYAPKWQVQDPESRPYIDHLESIRRKKTGFFVGGFTTPDTTPSGILDVPLNGNPSGTSGFEQLNQTMNQVLGAILNLPKVQKAYVSNQDIKTADQELSAIIKESSI